MAETRGFDEVLRLTQDLIAIESHVDAPGREREIAVFLAEWFQARGIDVELQFVEDGRHNVIARVGEGKGPSLMLNGHLDTVPAGSMQDAFTPRLVDGVLWGRGACDMKGAVAAMATTLAEIKTQFDRGEIALRGELAFAGTVGEETGSIGVKTLAAQGLTTDYAIVGEPTSLRIGTSHKGACFVRIALTGRGAHGSRPHEGVNAVSYAAEIVRILEGEYRASLASRVHPLLGAASVNVGRIDGGTQPNIVAESCLLEIDRRTIPGEGDPVHEIRAIVEEQCAEVEGLSHVIEEMDETSLVPHVPLATRPDSRLVGSAAAACAQAGLPAEPVGVTYWTDGGHLAAGGVETIILGPGDIANAHGPDDRLTVTELSCSVDLYCAIARLLLTDSD